VFLFAFVGFVIAAAVVISCANDLLIYTAPDSHDETSKIKKITEINDFAF